MQFYYIRSALYLLIHLCASKNLSGKFFAKLFFKKASTHPRIPRIPRIPSQPSCFYFYDEDGGVVGAGTLFSILHNGIGELVGGMGKEARLQ